MKSETELRVEVMKNMIKTFGLVDATRFIDLIKRDKFNYTQWQRDLWKDKTATEIHNEAKEYYLKNARKKN